MAKYKHGRGREYVHSAAAMDDIHRLRVKLKLEPEVPPPPPPKEVVGMDREVEPIPITYVPRSKTMVVLDECVLAEFPDYDRAGKTLSSNLESWCDRIGRPCSVTYVGNQSNVVGEWRSRRQYRRSPRDRTYMDRVEECAKKSSDASSFKYCVLLSTKDDFGPFINERGEPVDGRDEPVPWLNVPPRSSDDRYIRDFAQDNNALILSCDSDWWLESSLKNSDRVLIKCRDINQSVKLDKELMQVEAAMSKTVNMEERIKEKLRWLWKNEVV